MRYLAWLVPFALMLPGCRWLDPPPVMPDAQTLRNVGAGPQVANRDALAECLPGGHFVLGYRVTLAFDPTHPFTVEQRLADLGARPRADGAIVDASGKLIYKRSATATGSFTDHFEFVEAILTEAEKSQCRSLAGTNRFLGRETEPTIRLTR